MHSSNVLLDKSLIDLKNEAHASNLQKSTLLVRQLRVPYHH